MDYKHQSLEENRDQLKTDCEHIRDNIDDFKGKLSYINYDIGTGKSYTISRELIPTLVERGNRVLVLCYSYAVVMEWNENIKEINKDLHIFMVSSPSRFNIQKDIYCPHRNKHKSKGINKFVYKVCRTCDKKKTLCLYDWKNKLKRNDIPIVLTSQSFYFKHQDDFQNFDIVIFDEIASIDQNLYLNNTVILNTCRLLKIKSIQDIPEVSQLYNNIRTHISLPMHNYHKEYETISQYKNNVFPINIESHIPKESIDTTLISNTIYKLQKLSGNDEVKPLTKLLNQIYRFYKNTRSWHIVPKTKRMYMLYTENHYAEYYYHILGTKIIARKKIILPGIHDKINMTPAYLVLSALNSKDYIESLFQIRIPDSYHFGKDDNGKILLNRFPNVVCTTYVRGAYNTDKYKQPGYGINRTVSYQARNEIAKRIITFLEAFKDEKVAIGGAKNTFKLLTLESFDPNNSIQNMDKPVCHGINDYISTTGHGKQIVSYNKYRMLKEENRKSCIPYVHFGISGTNDLTDFRAILIINRFQISPHLNKIYCDTKHDEFAISDNSFHFNMDIAPARQLEGRLLRFCDNVQFKYIFRLNDYDKGYPGDLKGNRNGFPDCTTPLFEFKSQKLLDRCILGLKEWNEYTSLSESVKESVNTNLWGNIFDSLENGNRIYKDRRRMTYIITKYIEFYYKKREEYAKLENKNDTNDIPISIKDIDSDFFENYFLSTKNQRRYNENREKIYAVMHELIAGFPYLTELMN